MLRVNEGEQNYRNGDHGVNHTFRGPNLVFMKCPYDPRDKVST